MRKLLPFMLFLAAPAWGAYALVSGAHLIASNSSDFNGFTSAGIDTTGSTLLVVGIVYDFGDSSGFAFSDSKSNTWTALTAVTTTGSARTRLYYCVNPTVGSGHTFTISGSVVFGVVAVQGFTGNTATPFDVENSSDSTNLPVNFLKTNSVSPTQDNELIIAAVRTGSASAGTTVDSGFTYTDQQTWVTNKSYGFGMAYIINGTGTSGVGVNPKFSNVSDTTQMSAVIATFKAAAAAPTAAFGIINNPVPGGL